MNPILVLMLVGQPVVEVEPTENVEKIEAQKPATLDDIVINIQISKVQQGNEFVNLNLSVGSIIRNLELKAVVFPKKGKALFSSDEPKTALKGSNITFSGIATAGYGIIQLQNPDGSIIREIPYKVSKQKGVRQSIGASVTYSETDEVNFGQSVRYSISDSKGTWSWSVSINRSNKAKSLATGFNYSF